MQDGYRVSWRSQAVARSVLDEAAQLRFKGPASLAVDPRRDKRFDGAARPRATFLPELCLCLVEPKVSLSTEAVDNSVG